MLSESMWYDTIWHLQWDHTLAQNSFEIAYTDSTVLSIVLYLRFATCFSLFWCWYRVKTRNSNPYDLTHKILCLCVFVDTKFGVLYQAASRSKGRQGSALKLTKKTPHAQGNKTFVKFSHTPTFYSLFIGLWIPTEHKQANVWCRNQVFLINTRLLWFAFQRW